MSDTVALVVKNKSKDITILIDDLYPTVEKTLSNKAVQQELIKNISYYFDKNSEIIHDIGIAQRIFFLNSDKEYIMNAAGLDNITIKNSIKKSKYIKGAWKILNEPLNIASVLILRYFTIKKDDKMLIPFLMYYSFYFYASLHYKYLPYGGNEDIMKYTINNLTYKFKIKEYGSLYKAIEAVVMKSHETYKDDLIRGEDGDLAKYISALKVRLNDVVKNIKNEYTINYNKQNYMNSEGDDYSEENFHEADNTSYNIRRIADSSLMKLMTYGPDVQLAELTAQLSQVSQNEIKNVIFHLSNNDSDDILRLCELILQLYLFESGNTTQDIYTNKFLSGCLEIYKKSNTNDKVVLEIKEILDRWLKKHSDKYKKTNREATLSFYRRAIYIYFVLHIQTSNR